MFSSTLFRVRSTRTCCRRVVSTVKNDALKTPKYPEILDLSKKAVAMREKLAKHKRIEALKTVEEKLFALNLDKYYGWKCYILNEGNYPYQYLPFVRHITRTSVIEVDETSFHKAQGLNLEESQEFLSRVRPHIQEALLFALKGTKKLKSLESPTETLVHQLNSIILTYFSSHYPHLLESIVDYKPRVEAFWSVGGFHPSPELYEERKDNEDLSEAEREEPVEHWIQYIGKPVSQLRSSRPLQALRTSHIADFETADKFSPIQNDPSLTFGLEQGRRHGTNIPGFWPGDKNEFCLLTYHETSHLSERPPDFGEADKRDTAVAQALLASFSSLHAQASYQGFSTFSELTYPLVNQSILTDGRVFSFYLYQLNTMLLHSEHTIKNPRVNVCLALPPKPLYLEIKGNEFVGWNDEVLSSLLSCYLNQPKVREDTDMKPYVDKDETYLSDIQDVERRAWLHSRFRHMYSNRPRHKLPYEIYDWERIYKVKFETRQMEARRRPFELDSDPLEERKYFEHSHSYIPRSQRPKKKHWTNWRAKMAKTYYPEV